MTIVTMESNSQEASAQMGFDATPEATGLRVDAHVSLWEDPPPEARSHPQFPGDDRLYLPRHIGPILERSRFDGAVVVTAGTGEPERAQMVEWLAEPNRLLGVVAGWSDTLANSPATADLLARGTLRGVWIRLGAAEATNDSLWRPALEFCKQHQLVLEIGPATGPEGTRHLPAMVEAAESTPVVLSHLAGVPPDGSQIASWMEQLRAVAQHPTVCCKLSAVHSSSVRNWPVPQLAALFRFFIENFSEERLMYGSDWPYCLPQNAWKACLARFTQALGARSMEFREHILGGTATRVYGLRVPPRNEAAVNPAL